LASRSKIASEFGEAAVQLAEAVEHFGGDHQGTSRWLVVD